MIVGSLFSGAGLLDCGLARAGIGHGWFVERDEFRRGLLARRWPGVPVHDDVRTVGVGVGALTPVDGIVGGFPCKGASGAGKRTGFAHPETALWAEFERIVRELRPRYVLVENVRDILSLHRGEIWGTVLGDLAALGYDVAWDCVPASAVGAPHGRDRVFAIAHAQDGRWAAATDAGEPRGLGRHAGAATGAPADADGPRWPAGRQPERAQRGGDRDLTDEDPAEAPADPDERGREARSQLDGGQKQTPADGASCRRHAHGPDREVGRGVAVEWGEYEPAIRRWEAVHGPAPEPLVSRLDDGDAKLRRVRARVDRSRLSALGDGVHVHVGRLLGDALMALYESDREASAA